MPQKQQGFVAIVVVLVVLAVAVVGGYLVLSKNLLGTTPTPAPSPMSQPKKELSLVLQSPTDGTLATDGMVMIKGKTLPNTTVAFYTDTAEDSVESDASGNFEGSLELENGINTLTITAFGEEGDEKSTTLDVVYDEEQ